METLLQRCQRKAENHARTLLAPGVGVKYLTLEDVNALIAHTLKQAAEYCKSGRDILK